MRVLQGESRLIGAVGAVAAGLGGAQTSDAAVVHMDVNANIPPTYNVNLGGGGNEFNVAQAINAQLQPIGIKADTFAPTTGIILDSGNNQAANLALGTLIDSSDTFTMFAANGLTRLSGLDSDGNPVGNFNNVSGYVGVQFLIGSETHYGYVGYEGMQSQPTGRVFAIGWEDAPNTGVLAGGIPEPSSLALLAAGAAGLSVYRRRNSA
jgi:hypothetical protein